MHIVVRNIDIAFLELTEDISKKNPKKKFEFYPICQRALAEALPLDEDAVARGPGDLVVGDGDPHVPLGEDAACAPAPGDPAAVKIVVSHSHILLVSSAQEQQAVITLEWDDAYKDHETFRSHYRCQ